LVRRGLENLPWGGREFKNKKKLLQSWGKGDVGLLKTKGIVKGKGRGTPGCSTESRCRKKKKRTLYKQRQINKPKKCSKDTASGGNKRPNSLRGGARGLALGKRKGGEKKRDNFSQVTCPKKSYRTPSQKKRMERNSNMHLQNVGTRGGGDLLRKRKKNKRKKGHTRTRQQCWS